VLRRGLLVWVRCSEACHVQARMSLGKRLAAGGMARAGKILVRLRPDKRARRTLGRARSVRVRILVRAVDRAGNALTVRRTMVLRRPPRRPGYTF
jgi:hypothetical protein